MKGYLTGFEILQLEKFFNCLEDISDHEFEILNNDNFYDDASVKEENLLHKKIQNSSPFFSRNITQQSFPVNSSAQKIFSLIHNFHTTSEMLKNMECNTPEILKQFLPWRENIIVRLEKLEKNSQ